MSQEQLMSFLEKVKTDKSLQEKLKAADDSGAIIEIAKAAGFSISTDDVDSVTGDLSEEELEAVSGGTFCTPATPATIVVVTILK